MIHSLIRRLPLALGALSLAFLVSACGGGSSSKSKVRIQGSTTVNPIMTEVAELLRKRQGMKITVDTQGGSSGGISAVSDGSADIGMSSKPVSEADQKKAKRKILAHVVGFDAVALVVSTPIYEGGVKALDRQQIADIFTGKIKNWKQVGGPDKAIFVYNKEPGRGTRAIFEKFVFLGKAPAIKAFKNYAEVGANEETRQKIESHGSAVGQLSASWAENRKDMKIVGLKTDKGIVIPDEKNLKSGRYPMARKLFLLTAGEAKGAIKAIIDFTLSKDGQAIVRKVGYLPVNDGA